MTDEQALAAAREICSREFQMDIDIRDTMGDMHPEPVAEIISRHYQPQREAAQKMAEALRKIVKLCDANLLSPYPLPWTDHTDNVVGNCRAALAAWDSASKGAK